MVELLITRRTVCNKKRVNPGDVVEVDENTARIMTGYKKAERLEPVTNTSMTVKTVMLQENETETKTEEIEPKKKRTRKPRKK